jgi:parallel beta-helix repeat protein
MKSKFRVGNLVLMIFFVVVGIFSGYEHNVSAAKESLSNDPDLPFNTTITVDSGTDPDDSDSKTCQTDTPCTLRRAVIEARWATKPVLIQFNIPATSEEGYDSSLQIWRIEFNYYSSVANATLRYLNGEIVIDGGTQPGGRLDGPKIILVGPGTGQRDGIKLGETQTQDGNEIHNLGFQNFHDHIIINSSENMIENNWFGLSDDGSEPYLRNDEPEDGSGSSGVAIQSTGDSNTIQNNVFLGFDGVATAIRGDMNTFASNYVGTASDGTTPGKLSDPNLLCTPVDWLGGGGISMEGDNHIIENNTFAGLRQEIFTISSQPDAIRLTGTGHLVQGNMIGVDSQLNKVGVCGRGIFLSDSPQEINVLNNTIVDPGLSGISLNGALYDENTLRTNTIEKSTSWPEVEGNPEPENAIQVGASMSDEFKAFEPAKVTEISGVSISGTSGNNSPCPNCVVEVFLDDKDTIVEALQSLIVVTAGADGNWSATLPFELSNLQGLRTTSTTAQYNTIPFMSANTTTSLSRLYTEDYSIYIPLVVR